MAEGWLAGCSYAEDFAGTLAAGSFGGGPAVLHRDGFRVLDFTLCLAFDAVRFHKFSLLVGLVFGNRNRPRSAKEF